MKLVTPEISWHNRDPIYSIDFQHDKNGEITRLVTSGTDKNIRIWRVIIDDEGQACTQFLATLTRHTRAVNAVRFSPNGEILASGGDDSVILLWQQNDNSAAAPSIFQDEDDENLENWSVIKTLRGHIEDIYDLCWSADSNFLISGSVDNSAIMWDVKKGKSISILKEHKSFVQGVAWDPLNQYVATLSCDRCCRIYNVNTKQCIQKVTKLVTSADKGKSKLSRMFHDDSMKSFFRRLCFSPDGELLITPAGCIESGDSVLNTSYIFTRGSFSRPALHLPVDGKASLIVRCSPVLFELRKIPRQKDEKAEDVENNNRKEWEKYQSLFCLPYRIIFAVATEDAVLLYDTQQAVPFLRVTNIHYHQLSDLAWSSDGRILAISSTDGYCSFISFQEGELGKPYKPQSESEEKMKTKENDLKKMEGATESVKLLEPVEQQKENTKIPGAQTSDSPDVQIVQKPTTCRSSTVSDASSGKRRVSLITLSSKSPSAKPNLAPPSIVKSETPKQEHSTTDFGGATVHNEEEKDLHLVLELSGDESSQSTLTQEDLMKQKRRIQFTTLSSFKK
ncbi:chromatin assembly factor 1 subunit B-like [Tubulanus polymorphus]|uniref:chromatin assembly factor 1 subunit B-like n=1 Tax=Tubulanus polymorphus TaxID=672921 RepID=UPI003DA58B8B